MNQGYAELHLRQRVDDDMSDQGDNGTSPNNPEAWRLPNKPYGVNEGAQGQPSVFLDYVFAFSSRKNRKIETRSLPSIHRLTVFILEETKLSLVRLRS